MERIADTIKLMSGVAGMLVGYFLGGCDGLIYTLVAFVVIDYVTGVMCAISEKKLSSEVGFRGIFKKVVIFFLVGIGHMIDVHVLGNGAVMRTAVIFFYLANEGISLTENAARLGLPIPKKLREVLESLKKDGDSNER